MKILISAYACEPGKGSEPEVGLQTMRAAAQHHDVWLVTRQNNVTALRAHLASDPLRDRIHVMGFDIPGVLVRLKKRAKLFAHHYYDSWQRALAERAVELDRRIGFDLVHHATFAAYWKRAGVAAVQKPFVWGPVGGGVTAPLSLYGALGARGIAEDLARKFVRPLATLSPGVSAAQRSASVALAQNAETARRLRTRRAPQVIPNALAVAVPERLVPSSRQRTVLSVARLEPWKSMSLALQAFAASTARDTRHVVIGDGPEFENLRALARSLGLSDRVSFRGRLPRDEVLRALASAAVLLHPALHEEAGLVVSEALSYGTPVICVRRGGPPELLEHWPSVPSVAVPPGTPRAMVDAFATGIDLMLSLEPSTGVRRPARSFEQLLHDAYHRAVKCS